MTDEGEIKSLNRLFLSEKGLITELDKTPIALRLKKNRLDLADTVGNVGKSGDLNRILAVERRFLENDLAQHTNSSAMKQSLDAALNELASAEKHVCLVDDAKLYQAVDAAHSLPKNRKGPLPYDEARQFFNSHAARLINMDKVRLDAEEKKIVDARKHNMRLADTLYIARQRKTLGLETAPAKKRGQELSR